LLKQGFKQLIVGLRRYRLWFLAFAFVGYSVVWTIVESVSYLLPAPRPEGLGVFSVMIVVGICWGAYRVLPQKHVELRIKSIDTTIEVKFGDIFESEGLKAIPVNEFFDSDLGNHVASLSIHGQLIERFFSGHSESFDKLVENELDGKPYESVKRKSGRERRYSVGTTPVIDVKNERFLLPALCYTDLGTLKASCDVPTLWKALTGLWSTARNRANGDTVSVPLIGGGLAGIGLPPSQLLQLILLSIVTASRERHITSVIHIVLPWKCFEEIDLKALSNHWS